MLIHVAKYCKLTREHPNVCYSVLIVESRHHQKEHVQDRELACFVWQELHKTLPNLTIKFENCDNNIGTFQDKVEYVLHGLTRQPIRILTILTQPITNQKE